MIFVDKVNIKVRAGNGGHGHLSFRHEKFISMGGPDGGDGGKGGDIVFKASRNQNTLTAFRYKKEVEAKSGNAGEKRRKHGRNGLDLIIEVPVGTQISNEGTVLTDLVEDGQTAIIARGGKGGFGNAHFVSSVRQAPNFRELGEPGEELDLTLELKMIADVGLVGLPNAGKSTLLSKISNARPEIADYPFTTLTPNLGVVDVGDSSSLLIADIPGLIEGAAEGKGLGHDFLRHIERTAVILHLIDAYIEDVAGNYLTIKNELKAYSKELAKRPEIIVLNKIDGLDEEIVNDSLARLKVVAPKGAKLVSISGLSGQNLKELIFELDKIVKKERTKPSKLKAKESGIPTLTLEDQTKAYDVTKLNGKYVVRGATVERFARRTDFGNEEGIKRLRDIMRRSGILHELSRQGIEAGETIQIGNDESRRLKY
jgi:GTP-binding protein